MGRIDTFESEVADVRVEFMARGALVLFLAVSLLSVPFAAMEFPFVGARMPVLMAVAVFSLTGLTAYLLWTGKHKLGLWVSAWGAFVLAILFYLSDESKTSAAWVAISIALVTLLVGSRAGWCAVGIIAAGLGSLAIAPLSALSVNQWLLVLLPCVAMVYLVHMISGILLRVLRWVSESYEIARRRADEIGEKSAQLALAMKSLDQTSLALARANEQLERMVQFAEEARQAEQEFAARISHELRAPLNLVVGFSEVLLAEVESGAQHLPADITADLHAIHRNSRHLLTLVNDILDLSQIDISYMTIVQEPVKIGELVGGVVEDYTQLTEMRNLYLHVAVEPDLPILSADGVRIRQVLLNLVNNALRFTECGGITIQAYKHGTAAADQAEALVDNDAGEVVVRVADTGVGIPEAELQRIFEPFVQLQSGRRQQSGTGLGLTISKRFIELHGGRMWVESVLGKGSAFYFALPVKPIIQASSTQSTPLNRQRREVGALAVVEPYPLLSGILSRHLAGISVVHATSIHALAEGLAGASIEAVLLNEPAQGSTPADDWPETLGRVPVLHCHFPGSLVLHQGQSTNKTAEIKQRFLAKPVTRDQVMDSLRAMLTLSEPADQTSGRHHANRDTDELGGFDGVSDGAEGYDHSNEGDDDWNVNGSGSGEDDRDGVGTGARDGLGRRTAYVLIVDDEEDALQMMSKLLRTAPKEVCCPFDSVIPIRARSGEQALELLEDASEPVIHAVFLDLALEGMSGSEVMSRMRQHPRLRDIPICLLSGHLLDGAPLVAPFLTLGRSGGLPLGEVIRAVAMLLHVTLPGVQIKVREGSLRAGQLNG